MNYVSIAISTIGGVSREFFFEAVESALKCSEKICDEILIIENSQNSKFAEYSQLFSSKDNRVKTVSSSYRLGMADCWNLGLNEAKNKWFVLLHDDDVINFEEFNKLEEDVLNKEVGFISCNFFILKNKKTTLIERTHGLGDILENTPKFVSTLIHREKFLEIGGWDERAGYGLDLYSFIKLNQLYGSYNVKKTLGYHRIHSDNASSKVNREKGYVSGIAFILENCLPLIEETRYKRNLVFHLVSFSFPHRSLFARSVSKILKFLGRKVWFEKG